VLWSQRYRPHVLGAGTPTVSWASPSGSTVIASVARPGARPSKNGDLSKAENVILASHHLRPLPGSAAPDEELAW